MSDDQVAAPVFIVSGGTGASGEQLLNTVLAQFPEAAVRVVRRSLVRDPEEIAAVVVQAAKEKGVLVHTLVDPELRSELIRRAKKRKVAEVDLMGPLLASLTVLTGTEPLVEPGLYRRLRRDYFERIGAIEFAIDHDDGQNYRGLRQAEIVLLGVSRAGKTPLSMVLAMQGWLVANLPVVPGVPLPEELDDVDARRVVGLVIEHEQLLKHRQMRHTESGLTATTPYIDPARVHDEAEA